MNAVSTEAAPTKVAKIDTTEAFFEARSSILVGMTLVNAVRLVEAFQEERDLAVPDDETNFDSFSDWLKRDASGARSHPEISDPRVVMNSSVMFDKAQGLFGLPLHNAIGLGIIKDQWVPRLGSIVESLNAHPLMDGLPELEVHIPGTYQKFEIRFKLEA